MRRLLQKILWNILLNILALAAVVYLLESVQFAPVVATLQQQARTLLLAGFIIGVLNITVKPIITLLTLPVVLLTVGLFLLVINAFIFYATVEMLPAHELIVRDPSGYFWGALLFSGINTVEHTLVPFRAKH